MGQNLQFPADLVTFTEKALMENFIFCAVGVNLDGLKGKKTKLFNESQQ